MILPALTEHYEALAAQGKIARPGWADAKISFALCLGESGELERVASTKTEQTQGKKTVLAPQKLSLPAPVTRTAGVLSNFLWDNSSYILGVDAKGKPQRSLKCFEACKVLHHQVLDGVDSPGARALLAFLDRWDPAAAAEHPALKEDWEELTGGANLVFRYHGDYLHNDPMIRRAWQRHYDSSGEGPEMVCLVTGQKGPVEAVHPSIKGVAGGQTSGTALVSFNAPAFCSYGRDQSLNAPVSRYAAFAYTAALNCLLADREHLYRVGETTILFWAKSGQPAFQGFFAAMAFGGTACYDAGTLGGMLKSLLEGKPVLYDETRLDPGMDFYILGISPNAARLSVRFFLRNSFGGFLENVQRHNDRLFMKPTSKDRFETIYISALLDELIDKKSKEKRYDKLFSEILASVLADTRYPYTLRSFTYLRIQSDREINRTRAGILKACLLKAHEIVPKSPQILEALQMELNKDCTYQPYLLGRLFSVMEQIQLASTNWEIKRSIKDSYFTSVAATPKIIFSKLFPLSEYHLRKLKRDRSNLASKLENEKDQIIKMITAPIPTRFNPDEIDCFYIGYFHQNTKEKK